MNDRHLDLDGAIRYLESLHGRMMAAAADGCYKMAEEGHAEALRRSSGTFSVSDLAQADHPYAVRHGFPLLAPDIINVQSGAFRASWTVTHGGQEFVAHLESSSPILQYLIGRRRPKSRMFVRPVDEAVAREMNRWGQTHIAYEVGRVI